MKIITDEQIARIKAMHADNVGHRTIAKTLGIPPSTVRYWIDPDKANRDGAARRTQRFNRHPLLAKMTCYKNRKLLGSKARDFQRRVNGTEGQTLAGRVTTTFTLDDVLEKLGTQPRCYLSGRAIDIDKPDMYTFDHIVPVTKGGDNSLANLGLLASEINMMKSDKTPEECVAIMIEILRHQGYTVAKVEEGTGGAPERTVHASTQVRAEG